jgi:hypothetical protein
MRCGRDPVGMLISAAYYSFLLWRIHLYFFLPIISILCDIPYTCILCCLYIICSVWRMHLYFLSVYYFYSIATHTPVFLYMHNAVLFLFCVTHQPTNRNWQPTNQSMFPSYSVGCQERQRLGCEKPVEWLLITLHAVATDRISDIRWLIGWCGREDTNWRKQPTPTNQPHHATPTNQ